MTADRSRPRIGVCPHCGYTTDRVSGVLGSEGNDPDDGAVSVCLACGLIAVFDHSAPFGVRQPTPAERAEILADPDVQRVIRAWQVLYETSPSFRQVGDG